MFTPSVITSALSYLPPFVQSPNDIHKPNVFLEKLRLLQIFNRSKKEHFYKSWYQWVSAYLNINNHKLWWGHTQVWWDHWTWTEPLKCIGCCVAISQVIVHRCLQNVLLFVPLQWSTHDLWSSWDPLRTASMTISSTSSQTSLAAACHVSIGTNGQQVLNDDVINWKHFPCYWPFVIGIHRSLVNSTRKGQWCGTLMFSLFCAWTNSWANTRDTSDLRCHCAHYDVSVMLWPKLCQHTQ